jgi:hypothetical protein
VRQATQQRAPAAPVQVAAAPPATGGTPAPAVPEPRLEKQATVEKKEVVPADPKPETAKADVPAPPAAPTTPVPVPEPVVPVQEDASTVALPPREQPQPNGGAQAPSQPPPQQQPQQPPPQQPPPEDTQPPPEQGSGQPGIAPILSPPPAP